MCLMFFVVITFYQLLLKVANLQEKSCKFVRKKVTNLWGNDFVANYSHATWNVPQCVFITLELLNGDTNAYVHDCSLKQCARLSLLHLWHVNLWCIISICYFAHLFLFLSGVSFTSLTMFQNSTQALKEK